MPMVGDKLKNAGIKPKARIKPNIRPPLWSELTDPTDRWRKSRLDAMQVVVDWDGRDANILVESLRDLFGLSELGGYISPMPVVDEDEIPF